MRYELSDREWGVIKPVLSNKPRGIPPVPTGAFSTASSGYCGQAPWRDLPESRGLPTTCYNRFVR